MFYLNQLLFEYRINDKLEASASASTIKKSMQVSQIEKQTRTISEKVIMYSN
jgi:hypothetical protein